MLQLILTGKNGSENNGLIFKAWISFSFHCLPTPLCLRARKFGGFFSSERLVFDKLVALRKSSDKLEGVECALHCHDPSAIPKWRPQLKPARSMCGHGGQRHLSPFAANDKAVKRIADARKWDCYERPRKFITCASQREAEGNNFASLSRM